MAGYLMSGFSDAVHDSQHVFRQTLQAMSEPGQWVNIPQEVALADFYSATTAVMLTFLDNDTALWLPEKWRSKDISQNLTFHCGCPLISEQSQAQFAIYDLADFLAEVHFDFAMGSDRYPDQSTTIVIQLPVDAPEVMSVWQGAGIETERVCSLPLNDDFWALRQKLIEFPRGVDFILTCQDRVMGLPRTTQVTKQREVACM